MKIFYFILLIFPIIFTKNSFSQEQELIIKTFTQGEVPPNNLFHFPNSVRTKYVQIDFSKLDETSVFNLQLFDNQNLPFKFKKSYQYKVGSSSWFGQSTEGMGTVIVSFYKGNIKGMIRDNQMKKYMIQQINLTDIFAITEVNIDGLQESAKNAPDYVTEIEGPHKKSRANPNVCLAGTSCPPATVIDVMVLGTADAIVEAGGTVAAFTTDVTSAVTEMNGAYTSSGGLELTFDLVHTDLTAYTNTAALFTDLTTFSTNATVIATRNTYYADLVGLWVESGSYAGYCGVGKLNIAPGAYSDLLAYTITDYSCGMTNLTYAHECGHNMGLRHDYYVDGVTTPCSHHHGYVNEEVIPDGLPVAARWRTIMAYNDQCIDWGFSCTRIPYWSDPTNDYLGDPMGLPLAALEPAYEMYGFERFRCVVADFRASPLPVQLISFSGNAGNDFIRLQWQTASESNSKGFEIEMRRSFAEDFKNIGFVQGKGNSQEISNYEYTLKNAMPGTYYFRLKQIDLDNKSKYSDVIKIEITGSVFQTVLYPNPVGEEFTLSFYNPRNQQMHISLNDLPGNEIKELFDGSLEKGYQEISTNARGLHKGIYFCTIVAGNDKQVIKLVIEK